MSRSAIIVFGLALLLLGLGGVLMFTPKGEPPRSGPLLGVQPSDIAAIRVRRPGASEAEIVARDSSDRWRFRFEHEDVPVDQGWPVLMERARGVARVLANLKAVAGTTRAVPPDALRVEVGLNDGTWRTLLFDDASVGGHRAVEIDRQRWLVDEAIVDLFRSPGLRGWRDPAALPGLNIDVARVTIDSPGQQLRLARGGGAWRLEAPFMARGDEVAIRQLIAALAGIRVERFIDDPDGSTEAPEPARIRITCETDERQIGDDDRVEITTRVVSLALEGPADVAGQTFFASDALARRFVVAGSALTGMSLAPESYVALTPTAHTPADVGMVQITEPSGASRAYRRGLGQWTRLLPDGAARPEAGDMIQSTLQLLCSTPAKSVATSPPPGMTSLADVMLLNFDNGPLVELGIGATGAGQLVVRVTPPGGKTPIYLIYESAAPEFLLPGADDAGPT